MEKIFTPEFIKEIGFVLVYEKNSEFPPYQIYGFIKDRTGMTHIQWNEDGHSCTYFGVPLEQNVSMEIKKDAGTRTAFNGYVFNQDDVRNLLRLTW